MQTLLETPKLTVEHHGKFLVIKDGDKAVLINTQGKENTWEIHFDGVVGKMPAKFTESFVLGNQE